MTGVSRFLEQNKNGWKYSKDEKLGTVSSNYFKFDYLITGEPKIHTMHDSNSNRKWDIIHVSSIFSGIDFKFTNGTLFKVRPNIYVLKNIGVVDV